jgi:hypothetical protein
LEKSPKKHFLEHRGEYRDRNEGKKKVPGIFEGHFQKADGQLVRQFDNMKQAGKEEIESLICKNDDRECNDEGKKCESDILDKKTSVAPPPDLPSNASRQYGAVNGNRR